MAYRGEISLVSLKLYVLSFGWLFFRYDTSLFCTWLMLFLDPVGLVRDRIVSMYEGIRKDCCFRTSYLTKAVGRSERTLLLRPCSDPVCT